MHLTLVVGLPVADIHPVQLPLFLYHLLPLVVGFIDANVILGVRGLQDGRVDIVLEQLQRVVPSSKHPFQPLQKLAQIDEVATKFQSCAVDLPALDEGFCIGIKMPSLWYLGGHAVVSCRLQQR